MTESLVQKFIAELVRKELQLLRGGDSTQVQRTRETEKIADKYYKELGEK